jgi:minimal PKS chain-length factor (CLF/KS beta)
MPPPAEIDQSVFPERTVVSVPDTARRTVFTGVGVVAPNGSDTASWWDATKKGESGIDRIESFDPSKYDTQLAGEVGGFEPESYLEKRLMVQTDRWTWMALAATQMAFEDAKFDPEEQDPWTMSAVTASSSGGNEFGQREIQALWDKGPGFVGAYQSIAWFYAATTGQISIRHGMKGTCGVVVSEGTGGLEALQHSRRIIRRGMEHVVSGGLEAPIGPYAITCQMRNGFLSKEQDPAAAYRPFDARASGYVPGEGGAILMLETAERAKERGAPQVYGELAGYGATNDAHHYGNPAPDGKQYVRAMQIALKDAGVGPDEVDVVFADGAGTPEGDAIEAAAIKEVFGKRGTEVPVTVPKTMVGRLYAGGASLDVATALLAMRDGVIPPTINLDEPDPACDLDYVANRAREASVRVALCNCIGFGSKNSAILIEKQ